MYQLLPIEDGYAQSASRQVKPDRPADDPAAHNHGIVCLHANILSVCRIRRSRAGVAGAILPVCGQCCDYLEGFD